MPEPVWITEADWTPPESIWNSLKQTEPCLNLSETPWSRPNLPDPVQNSLTQNERCLLEFDYACLTLSKPATASWTCLILSEPAWTFLNCLNLSEPPWWLSDLVWTSLNLPETVWNSLNLPQSVLTGFKTFLNLLIRPWRCMNMPTAWAPAWTCLSSNPVLSKAAWTHMNMPDCLHLLYCLQTCLNPSSTYTIYICVVGSCKMYNTVKEHFLYLLLGVNTTVHNCRFHSNSQVE